MHVHMGTVCLSICVCLHYRVCPNCTVCLLSNGLAQLTILSPLLSSPLHSHGSIRLNAEANAGNPTQANHFTANQREKCSISWKRIQPAEKQTETEQDCNVYLSGTKDTVNKHVCGWVLNKGFSEVGISHYEWGSRCSVISKRSVSTCMRKPSPNHHTRWEQAASDEAWKGTHKHTQIVQPSQILPAMVCQHLTTVGPPERLLMCLTDKVFLVVENVYRLHLFLQ